MSTCINISCCSKESPVGLKCHSGRRSSAGFCSVHLPYQVTFLLYFLHVFLCRSSPYLSLLYAHCHLLYHFFSCLMPQKHTNIHVSAHMHMRTSSPSSIWVIINPTAPLTEQSSPCRYGFSCWLFQGFSPSLFNMTVWIPRGLQNGSVWIKLLIGFIIAWLKSGIPFHTTLRSLVHNHQL